MAWGSSQGRGVLGAREAPGVRAASAGGPASRAAIPARARLPGKPSLTAQSLACPGSCYVTTPLGAPVQCWGKMGSSDRKCGGIGAPWGWTRSWPSPIWEGRLPEHRKKGPRRGSQGKGQGPLPASPFTTCSSALASGVWSRPLGKVLQALGLHFPASLESGPEEEGRTRGAGLSDRPPSSCCKGGPSCRLGPSILGPWLRGLRQSASGALGRFRNLSVLYFPHL